MLRTIALLSLTLHLAPAARADITPPGYTSLHHELVFEGLDEHPELAFFLAAPAGWGGSRNPIALSEGEGVSRLYHLLSYPLVAVPHDAIEAFAEADSTAEWSAQSERSFDVASTISQLSRVRSRKTIYRVTGIADGVIQVEHTRTEERDADGELLGGALSSENGSGAGPSMGWMLVYGAIALLSVAGLAFAFLRRG